MIKAKERLNLVCDLASYEHKRSQLPKPLEPVDLTVVGSAKHVRIMREATRRSITIVQDDPFGGNLPLGNERVLVIELQTDAYNRAEDVLLDMGTLANALRTNGVAQIELIEGQSLDQLGEYRNPPNCYGIF